MPSGTVHRAAAVVAAAVLAGTVDASGAPSAVARSDGPARAGVTFPAGAILFRSGRSVGNDTVLHATDTRNGGLRDLGLVSELGEAHWSPDGRRIGFARSSSTGGVHDFLVVGADARSPRRIARVAASGGQLDWAPDGRRIVFTHGVSGRSALSVVGTDGRGRRRLTRPSRAEDTRPAWSPTGKWIAFVRDGGGCGRPTGVCGGLYVVSPDGKRLRRLPTGSTDGVIGAPSWSPDGKRIAFALCCDGGARVVGVDGTGLHPIMPTGTRYVAWSPNGRSIALAGDGATYVVRPNGTGARKIADRGVFTPSWSPDSRALAVEDRCCTPDIWAIAADGSGEQPITEGRRYGYGNYGPEWNPRALPLSRVGGALVSPANPTDSVAEAAVLRATDRVERLSADGGRVAIAYSRGRVEAWEPTSGRITRFGLSYSPRLSAGLGTSGFALAGDTVALSSISSGGGIDTWFVQTATFETPRRALIATTFAAWPGPCCSTPLEHLEGDGPLLVLDGWGPCRISQAPQCSREPKLNGHLYRITDGAASLLAADRGPLTLLSVDRGRILVDRENGALQLFGADGAPLHAVTYAPARLLGAKLQGDELAVLSSDGLGAYDARTGDLRRLRRLDAADARLVDVHGGLALYVTGRELRLHRFSDGAERAIVVPGTAPVVAQLEESGLFYAYAAEESAHPGRVAFVPFDQLHPT